MRNQKIKVLYFLSHPIQYFSPLLKELSDDFDLEVNYFSDASISGALDKGFGINIAWDTPLLEGYKYNFIRNYRPGRGLNNKFGDVWNPGVWNKIRKSKADIIMINDWTYSSSWLVLLSAFFWRKQVWLRVENPLNQELTKSRKLLWIKKLILKHVVFKLLVDKFLHIGAQSKSFFRYYGVPESKLVYTPYAVDNEYFRMSWMNNKVRVPEIKEQFNIPPQKKVILFSGKYIPKKRPMDLLEAFAKIGNDSYFLVMVGDGELRPAMEKFMEEKTLKNVLLTGFVNQSEIPLYYSIADVFVMCSGTGETWGLSVNEAMNFEKPVVVSDTCGCSADLVSPGINGFVFQEGNIDQLAGYLDQLLKDDQLCSQMGEASSRIILNFSIQRIVENIKQEAYEDFNRGVQRSLGIRKQLQ